MIELKFTQYQETNLNKLLIQQKVQSVPLRSSGRINNEKTEKNGNCHIFFQFFNFFSLTWLSKKKTKSRLSESKIC